MDSEREEGRRRVRNDGLVAVAEGVLQGVPKEFQSDAEALEPRAVCERGREGSEGAYISSTSVSIARIVGYTVRTVLAPQHQYVNADAPQVLGNTGSEKLL